MKRLEIKHVRLDQLKPWKCNPRNNERAVPAVKKSIQRFGFSVPILCDERLNVIAGHTRLEAAKRLGMTSVPVVALPLTGSARHLFTIAENQTSRLADWDTPKLKTILGRLRARKLDLSASGFSRRELRRLLREETRRENSFPEPPSKTRTRTGTCWRLGRHRLLCGDSRRSGVFTQLLGKRKVSHIFAGPPYFNQRAYSHWDDYAMYLQDMDEVAARCHAALREGGVLVWNVGNGSAAHRAHVVHHAGILEERGFQFIDTIIWTKTAPNYGLFRHGNIRNTRRYYPAHQWEALHIYQKPGPMPEMSAEATDYMWNHHTDVWRIPAVAHQARNFGHPAVCPVEVPFRTIQAYTAEKDSVLDPFGGSGTTLIAAERAGRTAFLIEKSPAYCDQTVKRWEQFTGKRARREPGRN